MKTLSIAMSVMGVFAVSPMYSSARSVALRVFSSAIVQGSGTF